MDYPIRVETKAWNNFASIGSRCLYVMFVAIHLPLSEYSDAWIHCDTALTLYLSPLLSSEWQMFLPPSAHSSPPPPSSLSAARAAAGAGAQRPTVVHQADVQK